VSVVEIERTDVGSDAIEVLSWHIEGLMRAGFRPELASTLARLAHVDLHQAVELVRRGCPHELAYRILA
jgi:hypothetical protein